MSDSSDSITYLTVMISREGIAERSLFVPMTEIRAIELMKGTTAERPLVQMLFAIALIALGVRSIETIWEWDTEGGRISPAFQVSLIVFMGVGLWLLYEALRPRPYLLITMQSDKRKMVFRGAVDAEKLAEFIGAANRDFGCGIQSRLPYVRDF